MSLDALFRRFRPIPSGEDGAALLIALFVVMTVFALSIAAGGLVLAQSQPSQSLAKDVRTVHAAEGGIDAALGRLRAATTSGSGDRTKLPNCQPWTGTLGPDQGNLQYTVTITYYSTDPSNPANRGTPMTCTTAPPSTMPAFALISSQGTGSTVAHTAAGRNDRTLEATYNFKLTNANIAGGSIPLFNSGTPPLCMDAGSTTPTANTPVLMARCNGSAQQRWSYRDNLTIALTGGTGTTLMCLSAFPDNATLNRQITLQACNQDSSAPTDYRQQWSYNDVGMYQGANTNGSLNAYCFKTAPNVGATIYLTQECTNGSNGYDNYHSWQPDAKVGAGKAGDLTGQLVNYAEFGRCLDVKGQDVNAPWLIDYPCKQAPDPTYVRWNQKWSMTAAGQLMTASPSGNYCLEAGTAVPPLSGTRVLSKPCNTSHANQIWTKTGDTSVYATSYNFVTAQGGLCLSITGAPPEASAYESNFSMIIVETCNGSTRQKWNAPPDLGTAGLQNTRETTH